MDEAPIEHPVAATETTPHPAAEPVKTGWWRSLDRASRIALGAAVGLLVIALAVGAFGLSRISHDSTVNVAAARRVGPGGRFGPRGGPMGGGPMGGGMMRGFRTQGVATAAKTIGVSQSDLQSELAAGKSIADVAKAHNVDPQKVIDAIVAAERKQIDDAVKAGDVPQQAATRIEANLEQAVAARVYATGGDRGPRAGGGMFGGP
jgi:hypothetical protein